MDPVEVSETFPRAVDLMGPQIDSEIHPTVKYIVWQWENAPTTNKKHCQGYVELKKALSIAGLKELFGCPRMHLEPRKGTRDQARTYCMKSQSRSEEGSGPTEYGTFPTKGSGNRTDLVKAKQLILGKRTWNAVLMDEELTSVIARSRGWAREIFQARPQRPDPVDIVLRPWQKELLAKLAEPPQRRVVFWIWSTKSGTGKTTFYDYCCTKYDILSGSDYVNTVFLYDDQPIIWFDVTRAQSGEFIPYHAIEKFSNCALCASTKYVPTQKLVKCHVVVTANIPPDETKIPARTTHTCWNIDPDVGLPTVMSDVEISDHPERLNFNDDMIL